MALIQQKFSLILRMLMGLAIADTFTVESRNRATEPEMFHQKSCNFNEDTKTYDISDLLLCMNELSGMIVVQQNAKQNGISDRAYEDTRDSHPAFISDPDDSKTFKGAFSSNNYAANTLSSLLIGGLPLPGLPNLFDSGGFTRPDSNLFGALSSIARYDDLKCIPRILCEVASGSMPGSLAYKRSSLLQNFGQNALFRLLTGFDIGGGTSPILAFGRAALIGYANRGQSYACFREYPRCPQNPAQLVSYLNNYNGGFFRFFNAHNGNYYRPPQPSYYIYNRNSDQQLKNFQSNAEYDRLPHVYLGGEADRTGTGKLTLVHNDYYEQKNPNTNMFRVKSRESDSNKVVFPNDNQ